jgi:predicted transcriptional regulator
MARTSRRQEHRARKLYTVSLDPEALGALDEMAAVRGLNRSRMMEMLIRQAATDEGIEVAPATLVKRGAAKGTAKRRRR